VKKRIFLLLAALTIAVCTFDSQPASADAITTCRALEANDWHLDSSVPNRIYLDESTDSSWVELPEANFEPTMATAESLALYGYPERPSNDSDLGAWTKIVDAIRPLTPENICATSLGSQDIHGALATTTSRNWGGYWALGGAGAYIGIEGDYVQPGINSATCPSGVASAWIGLGGTDPTAVKLIQMGTDITASGVRTWYEYLTNTANTTVYLSNFTVSVGDHLHFYIVRLPADGYTTFSFLNLDSNVNNFVAIRRTLSSSYYDGTTAEWIMERPSISSGTFTSLANYGSINWSGMNAQIPAGTYVSLGSQTVVIETMKSSSGKVLDKPSGLTSSTSANDHWVACS
jgi:hypothetical protein